MTAWVEIMRQIFILLSISSLLKAGDDFQGKQPETKQELIDDIYKVIHRRTLEVEKIQDLIREDMADETSDDALPRTDKDSHIGLQPYLERLQELVTSYSCSKDCYQFEDEFEPEVNQLVGILKELKPVNGTSAGKDSIYDILYLLHRLRSYMSDTFFEYVFIRTIMDRKEADGISVPITEFDPESPVPYREYRGSDFQAFENLPSPVAGTPEERVDHFREDPFLHYFHLLWHINNERRHPRNRVGERFWFVHQQILARYFIERIFNGMEPVEPLGIRAMRSSFPSRYNGEKGRFRPTKEVCRLSRSHVRGLENRRIDVVNNRARSLNRAILDIESVYHDTGHMYISQDCKVPGDGVGFMSSAEVSARDPIFYRWHKEIDRTIYELEEFRGSFSERELAPASGITVEDFVMETECGRTNYIQTFQDVLSSTREGDRTFEIYNHEKFTWKIRIRNDRRARKKVIIRIYVVPAERRTDRSLFALMDQWTHTLTGQTRETIDRRDEDNSIDDNHGDNDCGFPRHLLVPHGSSEGSSPNVVRAVVFIHDVDDDVNEGEEGHKPVPLCGAEPETNTILDSRMLGFPVTKRWPRNMLRDALNNRLSNFGRIATNIEIVHRRAKRCTGRRPIARQPQISSISQNSTSDTSECPGKGYYRFGENCYLVGMYATDYSRASRYCNRRDGRLIDDATTSEVRELERVVRRTIQSLPYFWIGGSQRGNRCTAANSERERRISCNTLSSRRYALPLCIAN